MLKSRVYGLYKNYVNYAENACVQDEIYALSSPWYGFIVNKTFNGKR